MLAYDKSPISIAHVTLSTLTKYLSRFECYSCPFLRFLVKDSIHLVLLIVPRGLPPSTAFTTDHDITFFV